MKLKIDISLFFGVVLIFTGCSKLEFPLPTISTAEVTSITEMTAVGGGIISTDNGSMITARGVCWSTSPNPTIKDNKLLDTGDGPGTFYCNLTGLNPITTYYLRAFATNAGGTAYGEQEVFITKAFELTTIPPSFITATSAISGGLVSFDSDRPDAISRGVCWSTFPNPSSSDNRTWDGVGKGSFTSTLNGLKPFTTYYLRAFVRNINGTEYGNELNFTTQNGVISIETDAASSITTTTVTFSGAISGDGGSQITERGFCWSKTSNPTITDTKAAVGNGTGSFTKDISGLDANSIYYVRAYATNSFGTVYGNEQNFTTLVGVPKACFEFTSKVGFKVVFSNCSDYPTTCLWDFGDGTISSEKTPTHVYNSIGTYTVKLTVSNADASSVLQKELNVSDTVILNSYYYNYGGGDINYDIDGDNVIDIQFRRFDSFGTGHTSQDIFIKSLNGYEISNDSVTFFDKYYMDVKGVGTWSITTADYLSPHIYHYGNWVTSNSLYTNKEMMLTYYESIGIPAMRITKYDKWIKDEIRYIAFRKVTGNITKMGWLKVKITGYNKITILGYKMPTSTDNLLIDK